MKALKTSKGARKGGRPKKPKSGLVNVAPYMRFIRKVCSYKLVYDQLDKLEHDTGGFMVSQHKANMALMRIKENKKLKEVIK